MRNTPPTDTPRNWLLYAAALALVATLFFGGLDVLGTDVDDAQADPETQRHFFWYLKHFDTTNWNAYEYPETSILKEYKAEADPISDWYSEFSSGDAAYSTLTFAQKFVSSRDLYANFLAWAKTDDENTTQDTSTDPIHHNPLVRRMLVIVRSDHPSHRQLARPVPWTCSRNPVPGRPHDPCHPDRSGRPPAAHVSLLP